MDQQTKAIDSLATRLQTETKIMLFVQHDNPTKAEIATMEVNRAFNTARETLKLDLEVLRCAAERRTTDIGALFYKVKALLEQYYSLHVDMSRVWMHDPNHKFSVVRSDDRPFRSFYSVCFINNLTGERFERGYVRDALVTGHFLNRKRRVYKIASDGNWNIIDSPKPCMYLTYDASASYPKPKFWSQDDVAKLRFASIKQPVATTCILRIIAIADYYLVIHEKKPYIYVYDTDYNLVMIRQNKDAQLLVSLPC